MTRTKAKYLGIIYTSIFAILQTAIVVLTVLWFENSDVPNVKGTIKAILFGFHNLIPVVLVIAFFRAKKLGEWIIYGSGRKKSTMFPLLQTTSIALTLVCTYQYYVNEGNEVDWEWHGPIIFGLILWFGLYLVFYLPSMLFGYFLEQLLLQYKR